MATTDPFQKGGGTSTGAGNGSIPGGSEPPFQGPRGVDGKPAGGRGPVGGRIGPAPQGGGRKGGR